MLDDCEHISFSLSLHPCHSQHGPNEHPIKDEHGHRKYVHKKSQSKINHYSKDQDTLILSSDIPVKEPLLAEVNDKTRYNPTLIELKPNVHLSEDVHHPHAHHVPHHGGKHMHQHHQSHDFHHFEQHPMSKFRPHVVEMKGYKPAPSSHHLEDYEGPSSYSSSSAEYFPSSQGHASHEQPQVVSYKPAPQPLILVKKPVELKKVKYITPGLKHYATLKHINRNDYLNYNKNRAPPAASQFNDAVIHYRRSPRTLFAVPRYAPDY
jgi:hypothetical protein